MGGPSGDKLIRVDMTSQTATIEDFPAKWELLGGRALSAKILLAECDPTCDPLGPDNLLTLVPGVLAGTKAEREGILKWGGKMFLAQRRARVPKLHVTLRKSFGFGSTTMAQNPFDAQTLTLAFPGVTMSSMPAASGGRSAKLDAAEQAQVEAAEAGP